MIKLKEFANKLNGSEYSYAFPSKQLEIEAEEKGIVIVAGASDDLCELYGAVRDEFGCYDGGTNYIDANGNLYWEEPKGMPHRYITAKWCKDGDNGFTWTYDTDIPNIETFDMYDENEKYCRGFVFYLKDVIKE